MALTVYDVAKKAGVSIATISRVINNSPLVKEETRIEVTKLIQKIGYQPSYFAQRLSTQRSNTLGLVIPQLAYLFSSYYFLEILRGIEEETSNQNYGLSLHVPREAKDPAYVRMIAQKRVDGLILVALTLDDPGIAELSKSQDPVVLINSTSRSIPYIDVDNVSAGFRAVEHFVGHGRKKVAILNGLLNGANGKDRYQGFRDGMTKFNLPIAAEWILDGQYNQQRAYELVLNLIQSHQVPDAIFAANDLMALGSMQALRDSGIRVPDDVSIIGFDDSPSASVVEPALTTFRQPLHEMGKRSVQIVLEAFKDKLKKKRRKLQKEVVPAELMIRQSCGCTKQNGNGAQKLEN